MRKDDSKYFEYACKGDFQFLSTVIVMLCAHVCTYVHVYTPMYAYACTHDSGDVCIHVCTYTMYIIHNKASNFWAWCCFVGVHVCVCVCVCRYIYTHIDMLLLHVLCLSRGKPRN